ncbi:MAG: hypothetical protein ACKUBY_01435 [Candidatus Moraniibacteriota bacterium]|jgi:heme-degrading monooxygenase HmoA
MKSIILIVTFELNDQNLLEDWKQMSAGITAQLQSVDGFISRDSAVDEAGKIYCVVKWESMEQQKEFRKILESPAFEENMKAFAKIANMETMEEKFIEVI